VAWSAWHADTEERTLSQAKLHSQFTPPRSLKATGRSWKDNGPVMSEPVTDPSRSLLLSAGAILPAYRFRDLSALAAPCTTP